MLSAKLPVVFLTCIAGLLIASRVLRHNPKIGADPPADILHVTAIRHAESKWNSYLKTHMLGQAQGMSSWIVDSPLSSFGLRQAQRLAVVILAAFVLDNEGFKKLPKSADARVQRVQQLKALEKMSNEHFQVWIAIKVRVYMQSQHRENASRWLGGLDLLEVVQELLDSKVASLLVSGEEVSLFWQAYELLTHNYEEVQTLTGMRCDLNDTNVLLVTSNLIRAIDTSLLLVLPMMLRRACPGFQWRLSSNLQEIEHNRDCESRTPVQQSPVVDASQERTYLKNNMPKELGYVKSMYRERADPSANKASSFFYERHRFRNDIVNAKMDAELSDLFKMSGRRDMIWGVHSIWIRTFLRRYADSSDEVCAQAASRKRKLVNTAVIRFAIVRQRWEKSGSWLEYQVRNCEWVYLGTETSELEWVDPSSPSSRANDTLLSIFGRSLHSNRFTSIRRQFS
eukprot:TRINITY_DN17526_c0_g2_i1.p1 TRINITY_DN17526_c0_g2~~TRINITY_DN17526_c0_g2_i1.p1  ORF type:complete len:454 (+),score=33.72 TRINITY_DN17526_c0_g2_i1:67-1428(+)